MKIKLTQNKFTDVGPRDYAYLMQWSWCYHNRGYAVRYENTKTIYMHCAILERMGCKNFQKSDHINRDRLNNFRNNLRTATHRQSSCNQYKQLTTSSKYIGVSWYKRHKKWQALISVNEKSKHLGYFDSEIEAARTYNKAAKKYHGKFAVLNEV